MPRGINKRQKPIWQKIRKPIPPPGRIIESKLIKKRYSKEKFRLNYGEEENIKQKLRTKILYERDRLSKEKIEEKSKEIKEKLFSLKEILDAKNIFIYINFGSEVITKEIINKLFTLGKRVLVPITLLKEKKLLISEIKNLDQELEVNTFGILEPKDKYRKIVSPEEINLIIIPGIVFDKEGYRIGYGGGFYDRFLLEIRKNITCIGLAFELQVIESFPHDINDVPMHIIITEERIISI